MQRNTKLDKICNRRIAKNRDYVFNTKIITLFNKATNLKLNFYKVQPRKGKCFLVYVLPTAKIGHRLEPLVPNG